MKWKEMEVHCMLYGVNGIRRFCYRTELIRGRSPSSALLKIIK